MKYLYDLADKRRKIKRFDGSTVLEYPGISERMKSMPPFGREQKARVNILAMGDVGGTVLLGIRLLGADVISAAGIYDLDEKLLRRYEREINQVRFPDGRELPSVEIIDISELFDCDMFVFCASRGIPPIGSEGDVRMAQLEANCELISKYADMAVSSDFKGLFAVVSDPVDPLCKAALLRGIKEEQIQGYGLGVMNARAAYFAEKDERFAMYLNEGRAFGPHGEDLVIANSIEKYDDALSKELTDLAVNSNMETRADGFKPYIAPALSSGAMSLVETLRGGWNYSSVYFGYGNEGAFWGCRNRRTATGIEIEDQGLCRELYDRIHTSYRKLCDIH